MRKIFTLLVALLLTASVFAQAPQKMSYQAVIRNSSDQLVTNTQIGMEINIRQGSETGTVVYTETQTPTTNANGLVSIEIGGGAGFSTINWASDSYFIETKIAVVAPLTTYTITGTSQLLSVPYALHAKTAESITGTVIAGTNVTVTGAGTTASPYVINSSATHYVGELYGGGVIFWVDQTGDHGLICSMIDLSAIQAWSDVTDVLIGATAQSDWDGQSNSNAIIAQSTATSASDLCDAYTNADYGTGIFSDWYLPARGELNDLWNSLKAVQKALDSDGNGATTAILKNYYWSSSECFNYTAWYFSFIYGYSYYYDKDDTHYVRAVRAF